MSADPPTEVIRRPEKVVTVRTLVLTVLAATLLSWVLRSEGPTR